ncbi:hypothetical protein [Nocardia sp. NPDC058666]|uniref:hypothetical protein n=1 Tax=unclassified Nocardia TaxID=2637762 RepID=UPI00364CBEEB
MTYEEYRDKVIAAQEQWNQERSGIYLMQNLAQFSSIFGGGETQPNKLTVPDGFDGMSLTEMQNAVSAMKPSIVNDASEVWDTICQDLSTSLTTFNKAFEATVNEKDGWSGEAATAVVSAVTNYAKQSSTLPAAALAVSLKLAEMRTGLEQTQALMPGITVRPSNTGKTLPADGDLKMDDYTTVEAEEESRRILRTVYSQVAVQSDTGVPFMPAAPKIADGGGDQAVVGGDRGGKTGGDPGGASSEHGADGGTPETGSTPETAAPDNEVDESPSNSPELASKDETSAASSASPSTTTPAQTGVPSAATPTAQSPTATTPLVATPGVGRGGGGAPGAGRDGAGGAPTAGRAQPGTPTSDRAAASGARSAAAATGRAGMSGMGGMGAPGAGRGQDESEGKGIPDYLINQDNGDRLTGINEVETVIPVIGGKPDRAQS